jgi:hypothetical protein
VVTTGTYTGDTQVLNDKSDALYTKCDSGGGSPKACDSYLTWQIDKNATETFDMNVVFLGEATVAATMTLSYWNWTSGAWVILPNTLTFKATATSAGPLGTNEYLANKIPVSNQTINATANNSVRIRFYSSAGSSFAQFNNYVNLVVSHSTSAIQDLRGSGEVHVNAPSSEQTEGRYYSVESCDGFLDGRCAIFTDDDEFDLAEGELEEWMNISAVTTKQDVDITYTSPFTVDCTALYWIKEYNGTDWVDFQDYTLYSQPAVENCIVTIKKNIVAGTTYQFWVKFDNYMKWEVDWTAVLGDAVYDRIQTMCSYFNGTYYQPITESSNLSTDIMTRFCQEAYDDIYWFYSYFNDSKLVDVSGEYASYVQELRFYRQSLIDKYTFMTLGNNTPFMSEYYAKTHWEYPVRNLTYYNMTDTTNYTLGAIYVWNSTTRYLTYQYDTTNYTLVQQVVWNATNRNLTYYPAQVDMTNYTAIYGGVWQYLNRNLTYYPAATVDYAAIWTYANRNLTYYQDMTNYSYIAGLFDAYFGVDMKVVG